MIANDPIGGPKDAPKVPVKPATATAITTADDFKKDPKKMIDQWRTMIREDYRSGRPISEWRVFQEFSKMSKKDQEEICRYILDHYDIKPDIPADKIGALATAKDDLEKDLKSWDKPETVRGAFAHFSPKHLLVILFSIKGDKKAAAPPTPPVLPPGLTLDDINVQKGGLPIEDAATAPGTVVPEPVRPEPIRVTIGTGPDQITFILSGEGADQAKLKELYEMIKRFNDLLPPDKRVRTVELISQNDGAAEELLGNGKEFSGNAGQLFFSENQLRLSWPDVNIKKVIAHEMGHALFAAFFAQDPTQSYSRDKTLVYLYCLALSSDNSEIIDDSNYIPGIPDKFGHPRDNMSEMFASAVAAYIEGRADLSATLNDPDTPASMRAFGKLMFAYLRDKVFSDRADRPDDPLAGLSLADLQGPVTDEAIIQLILGLKDTDPEAEAMFQAIPAALRAGINDPRLYQLLVLGTQDKDEKIRGSALIAIGKAQLTDDKFIRILLTAAGSEQFHDRVSALVAFGNLGLKDPRIIKVLRDAKSDPDQLVQFHAYKALKRLGLE